MYSKLLGDVKGIFNKITIFELILSLIFIIMGILFFALSNMSNVVASILLGILLIVNGALQIFSFFKKEGIDLLNNNLIYGILLIIVGILAFALSKILTIILGIYLFICGIQKINYSLCLKKFHEESWLFTLIVGIVLMVTAVISFVIKGEFIVKSLGICILGLGCFNLISTLLLRHRSKYFLE